MKIKDNRNCETKYGSLYIGNVFKHDDEVYIKTSLKSIAQYPSNILESPSNIEECWYIAICLRTGEHFAFSDETLVEKLSNVELHINK